MPTQVSPVYEAALRRPSSVYERPSVAISNLLGGDPEAAAQAFLDPDELSPAQRQDLADRVAGPGQDDSVFKKLLRIGTNPLVVLGLLASVKWKIGNAGARQKWASSLEDYAKSQGAVARRLGSWFEIFPKPLSDYGDYVFRNRHEIYHTYSKMFGEAIDEFEKRAGRPFDKVTGKKIGIKMSGLENPDHPQWALMRNALGDNASKLLPKGFSPIAGRVHLDPHELALAQRTRTILDRMYSEVSAVPGSEAAIQRHMKAIGIAMPGLDYKKSYWPQTSQLTKEEVAQMDKALFEKAQQSSPEFRAKSRHSLKQQVSKNLYERHNATLLQEQDLIDVGAWNDRLQRLYAATDMKKMQAPDGSGAPFRRWTADYEKSMGNYTYGIGRTVAWVRPPLNRKDGLSMAELFTKELDKFKAAGNPIKAKMLEDTYIPLLTGRMSASQMLPSIEFAQRREAALEWFKTAPIPASMKRFLTKPLEDAGDVSFHKVGGFIQDYIFVSTLGFNTTSPARNLLQHVSTTIPEIGAGNFFGGVADVFKRSGKYFSLRGKGIPDEEAFTEAFPEFARSGLDIKTSGLDKFGGSINESFGGGALTLAGGLKRNWGKFRNTSLWMFTTSERGNRLSAFYGARRKALKDRVGEYWTDPITGEAGVAKEGSRLLDEAAQEYARYVTRKTQFGGGPLGYPSMTVNWPGPLRQYTTFPLRMLGYAWSADPATKARMLGSAAVATAVGKEIFDVDISDSVGFGAMPRFGQGDAPLGITPLVPPLVQGIAAAGQSIVEGSWEPLGRVAPIGVPLGLQASKTFPVLGPLAAEGLGMDPEGWLAQAPARHGRLVGRPYVDTRFKTEDGRYPMYRGDGSLVGNYSSLQLWAKAAGLGDLNGTQEVAAMKYLMNQREKIRGLRKQFAEAIVDGDTQQAGRLDQQYQKQYPGFGSLTLTIKKSDIRAVKTRRYMARIDRMLQTLPAEMRPQFAQAVATSLGADAQNFLGTDPAMLGQPLSRRGEGLPFATEEGVSGRDAVGEAHEQGDVMSQRGMNAFKGYM